MIRNAHLQRPRCEPRFEMLPGRSSTGSPHVCVGFFWVLWLRSTMHVGGVERTGYDKLPVVGNVCPEMHWRPIQGACVCVCVCGPCAQCPHDKFRTHCLSYTWSSGSLEPILGKLGNKSGDALDRVPTHSGVQSHTLSHTMDNMELPIWKSAYSACVWTRGEETPKKMGRTCKLRTHRARGERAHHQTTLPH